MKKLKIIIPLFACAFALTGQSIMDQFYPVDAGHSYLEFSVKYMGYAKVKGRFAQFSGMILYDENNLENTSVTLSAKTESIDTDGEWRDKDLKSANWFDVEKHPYMNFTSTFITLSADGFDVTGQLSIKGISKEVTFHMATPSGVLKDSRGDIQVVFTGHATIDRTDFGITGERWSKVKEGITAVSNKVDIEISILGKRYQEQNLAGFVRNPESPQGKLKEVYSNNGIEATVDKFYQLKEDADEKINANAINILGNYLMIIGELEHAIILFKSNLRAFPESQAAHTSLAEAYVRSGNITDAKELYDQLMLVHPQNTTAQEVLRHLE